ncbi:MAG: DNA repair protein RecN [Gammaproteobacteria bacterium]
MLRHLHIEDFAVVERLDLDLGPGMTVFTGETGAGKSIVVDALGLVLGDRADPGVVRNGCHRSTVCAIFDLARIREALRLLEAQGIAAEAGECIVTRHVEADGRSRAWINGAPVTARLLQTLGEALVDIHGQHAHQSLCRPEVQREVLDELAECAEPLTAVRAHHRDWREAYDGLSALAAGADLDVDRERDRLRHEVQEIEGLGLGDGQMDRLEREHTRLAHLARIAEGCELALGLLGGGSGDRDGRDLAAESLLHRAIRALKGPLSFDAELKGISDLLEGAAIQVSEADQALSRYLDGIAADPGALERLESRLAAIHDLLRKHGLRAQELPARLSELRARFEALEGRAAEMAALETRMAQAQTAYREAAQVLHGRRGRAAAEWGAAITRNLHAFGMPDGAFEITVTAVSDAPPSPVGSDRVEFLVTANPGQVPRALGKVASGGELSRLSLAIQVLRASDAGIATLVFDEVDAGIGGAVAEIVGRELRRLARERQVLCVTHLPQVASLAHQHVRVAKTTREGMAATTARTLDGRGRIEEVARMLGGVTISRQTLRHAEEMLSRAAR